MKSAELMQLGERFGVNMLNNYKKPTLFFILSVLLVFCAQSAFALSYSREEINGLLDCFEITEGIDFTDGTKNISRAEFVKTAVKLSNADTNFTVQTSFTDISQSEFKDYIETAYGLGIISDNNLFRPDDAVTRDEAIIMVVNAIGGRDIVNLIGTGSTGYRTLSDKLSLTDGISNTLMTYNDAVTMLGNALTSHSIEFNSSKFSLNSQVLYMNSAFNVYRHSGIVEANSYTGIYTYDGAGHGSVVIDGVTYTDTIGATEYFGRTVIYYTDREDDLICAYPKYDDDVFLVDAFEYDSIEDGKLVYYTDSNKRKTLSLADNPIFIVNGTFTTENAVPQSINYGTYTLIDSDNDGKYDICKITDLSVRKIKSVSKRDFSLTFEDTADSIKLESNEYLDVYIYSNGEEIDFSQLQTGDIVTIEQSTAPNMNYIIVNICTARSIDCQVTSVSQEENIAVFDDTEYKICPNVQISFGVYGTAYFDADGVCIYFENDVSAVYGYIVRMYEDEFSEDVTAKIYTERGRWVNVKFKDKVKFNGTGGFTPQEIRSMSDFYSGDKFKHQLISYRVNGKNEISEINTVQTKYTRWSATEKHAIDNGELVRTLSTTSATYRNSTSNFAGTIFLQPDTIIFMLSPDAGDKLQESDIRIVNSGNFVDGQTYPLVTAYNQTDWGATPVVLVNDADSVYTYSDLAVVLSHSLGLDGEECAATVVKCFYKGAEYSFFMPISEKNALTAGDVISFTIDNDGYISSYKIHSSLGDDEIAHSAVAANTNANSYIVGKVRTINHSDEMITVQRNDSVDTCIFDDSTLVWIYDKSLTSGMVSIGTAADIIEGKTVFLKNAYGKVKQAIVVTE